MELPQRTRTFVDNAIRAGVHVAPTAANSIGLTVGNRYISLARPSGRLTPAGRYYQQQIEARPGPEAPHERITFFDDDAPRRRINGVEQVRDRFGNWRTTRTWDPAANGGQGGHHFTRFGRDWGHTSVRYEVEVPVKKQFRRPNGDLVTYTHERDGSLMTVPVNSDSIGHMPMPADLRVARDVGSHNRQKAFIRDAIVRYLQAQPRDDDGNIVLVAYEQSDAYYTLNEAALGNLDNFFVNIQTEVFRGREAPYVETVLHRPLRYFLELPAEMLWKLDLAPEAVQDLGGQCVRQQLIYCVRRRDQTDGRNARNAERVWADNDDIEPLLDELEARIYPGFYEGQTPQPAAPDTDERRAHRDALAAFLPAWKREDNLRQRIFQKGVPRNYDELRKNYVSLNGLTRGAFAHLGSFSTALRANTPPKMPVDERLWYFFELFPEAFRVYRRSKKVLALWPLRAAAPLETLMRVKPEPYRLAGWREVGITAQMVIEVGRTLDVPVYVIHNDHKLHEFVPDGWAERADHPRSAIVFNIWGDHAFFYAPGSRAIQHAGKLRVHQRADLPKVRLQTRFNDDEIQRTRFTDMRPFDLTEFQTYLAWLSACRSKHNQEARLVTELERLRVPVRAREMTNRQLMDLVAELKTWSGVWYSTHIHEAYQQIQSVGATVYRHLGSKPKAIVQLTTRADYRRKARVKLVDPLFAQLQDLCDSVARWAKLVDFHYEGESPQMLCDRLCSAVLTQRRQRVDREAVLKRQGRVCDKCGAEGALEVHHKLPVSQGGGSDPRNLVGLCSVCHAEETATQLHGGMPAYRAYYSQMSPRLANLFMRQVRMPKAWIHGDGADPEDEQLHCLDIKGCRRSAIFTTDRLPVFGPADCEEPFCPEVPIWTHDFYWVDRGDEYGQHLYQGPNLYHRDLVLYMRHLGIVEPKDIVFGITASRHVPGSHFREIFEAVERALAELLADGEIDDELRAELKGLPKAMFNGMFGLWNRPVRLHLSVRRSGCVDDMRRVDTIRSHLGSDEGIADCVVKTKVIGCETAYPLGLVALHKELVAVHTMHRKLERLEVDCRGVHTDGVFFSWDTVPDTAERRGQMEGLRALLRETHPNGDRLYALKPDPEKDEEPIKTSLVPRCPQRPLAPLMEPLAPRPRMRVLQEHQVGLAFAKTFGRLGEMPTCVLKHILEYAGVDTSWEGQSAHVVVENGGALITGPPGTGKSRLVPEILKLWRQRWPDDKIVVMAPTHAAARLLPGGLTIDRVFHLYKYGKVRNTLFVVDEVGMVALSTIAKVAEWQLLGARFVMLGDFLGQFQPIRDPWAGAVAHTADIYRQMARSLKLELTTNRRSAGDARLWWFLSTLYAFVDQPTRLSVDAADATRIYPWDGELTAETRVFAISHRLRTLVNRTMNERFVRPRLGAVLLRQAGIVEGTLNQPQDMWILTGMVLQGCSVWNLQVLNGVHYDVLEATDAHIIIRMTERYRKPEDQCSLADKKLQGPIMLTHEQASKELRLLHCCTYRSAQGATIPRAVPVLLLDTSHEYFDHRTLVVGMSRVEHGDQLRLATLEQQEELFGYCGRPRPDRGYSDPAAPMDLLLEQLDRDYRRRHQRKESDSEEEPWEREQEEVSEYESEPSDSDGDE